MFSIWEVAKRGGPARMSLFQEFGALVMKFPPDTLPIQI